MKNPASIDKPNFNSPVPMGKKKEKKSKGNAPYQKFRRRIRRELFGKAL